MKFSLAEGFFNIRLCFDENSLTAVRCRVLVGFKDMDPIQRYASDSPPPGKQRLDLPAGPNLRRPFVLRLLIRPARPRTTHS